MTTPLLAAGYGVLAASGLMLGAVVGLWTRPAHRIVAAVMAFGSGTLLSAVAFDLCEEAFHKGGAVIVVCGFIVGGTLFVTAEAAIDSKGGFLRREGTREVFLKEKKAERAADILNRLSEVPLIQALPPEEVQAIVGYVEERDYQDGQVVFSKGETGDALYLLVAGEVKVTDDGHLIATLSKGSAFGEMALLTGEPRNATVTAVGPTRVYRIARDDFNHLMTHSRELAEGVHHLLEERIESREKHGDPQAAKTWQRVASAHLNRGLS